MPALYIVLAGIALVAVWLIAVYNGLIRSKNRVDEAFSDIDVQLKRRYDLIPNLVETVKGYMTHERETLVKLTEARTAAMATHDNPSATLQQKEQAENMLSSTLKTLFAVTENYPELKDGIDIDMKKKSLSNIKKDFHLILQDNDPQIKYIPGLNTVNMDRSVYHWGQRKLLISAIFYEFHLHLIKDILTTSHRNELV